MLARRATRRGERREPTAGAGGTVGAGTRGRPVRHMGVSFLRLTHCQSSCRQEGSQCSSASHSTAWWVTPDEVVLCPVTVHPNQRGVRSGPTSKWNSRRAPTASRCSLTTGVGGGGGGTTIGGKSARAGVCAASSTSATPLGTLFRRRASSFSGWTAWRNTVSVLWLLRTQYAPFEIPTRIPMGARGFDSEPGGPRAPLSSSSATVVPNRNGVSLYASGRTPSAASERVIVMPLTQRMEMSTTAYSRAGMKYDGPSCARRTIASAMRETRSFIDSAMATPSCQPPGAARTAQPSSDAARCLKPSFARSLPASTRKTLTRRPNAVTSAMTTRSHAIQSSVVWVLVSVAKPAPSFRHQACIMYALPVMAEATGATPKPSRTSSSYGSRRSRSSVLLGPAAARRMLAGTRWRSLAIISRSPSVICPMSRPSMAPASVLRASNETCRRADHRCAELPTRARWWRSCAAGVASLEAAARADRSSGVR